MMKNTTMEERPACLDFLKPWEEKMGVTATFDEETFFSHEESLCYSIENQEITEIKIRSDILSDIDFCENILVNLKKCTIIVIRCPKLSFYPEIINTFNNLVHLELYDARIKELPNSFEGLTSLKYFHLTRIPINELPMSVGSLKSVRIMSLDNTNIKIFPKFLCALPNLKTLNVQKNEFESLPKEILNLNLSFELDKAFSPNGIKLFKTKLQEMDINIFRKSRIEIKEYIEEMERGKVLLNESRVIFIGQGDAGKSSVINRLITEKHEDGFTATKGISITPWNVDLEDNRKVLIKFWDFGGQEIMHSMHEFFMRERCLYVIILNGRKDEQPEKWLDLIKQYGNDSPVMIVINQIDENRSADIDRRQINRNYGSVFGKIPVHHISCKYGDNFDEFKAELLSIVQSTETCNKWFPKHWYDVKTKLTDMKDKKGRPVNYTVLKQ